MPHLLAYKNSSTYHLARWNNSPSGVYRHLGAGRVTFDLTRDAIKFFAFGGYYHTGNVDVACGYVGAKSNSGELDVASQLETDVKAGNSRFSNDPPEWYPTSFSSLAYCYYCGGVGVAKEGTIGTSSESSLHLYARHFTLPASVRQLVARGAELTARVKVKGIGSWVMPSSRNTSGNSPYATIPDWENNYNYFGTPLTSASNYRLLFYEYPDALTLGCHVVGGSTLTRSTFNPSGCYYVTAVNPRTGTRTQIEFLPLLYGFEQKNGRYPTNAELKNYFGIDMDDQYNSHWCCWYYHGSRSNENAASRFAEQSWAMSNGGTVSYAPIYTGSGGSGWGCPYITGAQWNPKSGSQLFLDLQLTSTQLDALASQDGVWLIVQQLPMLRRTNCASGDVPMGGNYLPSTANTMENASAKSDLHNTGYANLNGKQYGTIVQSIADATLEVSIG